MALRDVVDHAVRMQREITAPTPIRRSSFARTVVAAVCVALLGFSGWSYVARPEFIWGPAVSPVPPERQQANMRVFLFLLAQRLRQYRETTGALPASLAALDEGDAAAGITYTVQGDSLFELRASVNSEAIVLRSTDDPDAFLGGSGAVLAGGVGTR